jgi:transglutaminase-like putative cysteine protease
MLFEISHRTDYRYGQAASEAYIEARLTPPQNGRQMVLSHGIEFQPATRLSTYHDYFGNKVTFYSMTLRHERLSVVNRLTVQTRDVPLPEDSLAVTLAEARQLFGSKLTDIFDYLQPTAAVPTGGSATEWARKYFPSDLSLREGLESLNRAIHEKFRYEPGSTDNATPLVAVWKKRAGVCQDFSHVMLSVLRTAGVPARYVCGYIETDSVSTGPDAPALIGSVATHAWVEALTPGMHWIALDPTNNQWCGRRHVAMASGRDFDDAAPLRGTFKGSGAQVMKVKVVMKRLSEKA